MAFEEEETQQIVSTLTPERSKMIFQALMASSVFFREKYIDLDVEDLKKQPLPKEEIAKANGDKNLIHQKEQARKRFVKAYEKKQASVTKMLEEEVETVLSLIPPELGKQFRNTVQYFTTCIEMIANAKDMNQMVGVIKMYSDGVLDSLFEVKEPEKEEAPKEENV